MRGKIVFDELEKAIKIYNEGFVKYNFDEICLLAKYLKHEGWRFSQMRKELRIRLSHIANENRREGIIISALKASKNYRIVSNNMEVIVTKNEMNIIKSLPDKYGKVLFVMLVVAKKDKYDNPKIIRHTSDNLIGLFYNRGIKSAIKTARVRMSKVEFDDFRYTLDGVNHYISATYGNENNWRICFADEVESCVEVTVTDLNNIISFFPYYCEKCGKKIVKNRNVQKYCQDCAAEKRRIIKRDGMRNARDKTKK